MDFVRLVLISTVVIPFALIAIADWRRIMKDR